MLYKGLLLAACVSASQIFDKYDMADDKSPKVSAPNADWNYDNNGTDWDGSCSHNTSA